MMEPQSFCWDSIEFPCNLSVIAIIAFSALAGFLVMLMVLYLIRRLHKFPRGNDTMNKISDQIKSGARAFLVTEYKYLTGYALFVIITFILLYTVVSPTGNQVDGVRYAACFAVGAFLSALAGWAGMSVATDANVRTAQAADNGGLALALRVAFTGGAVMGFTVVGLGLLGLSLMYWLITLGYNDSVEFKLQYAADSLAGFGFGASSIALFARVGGGIFTKAADIGADLVGKIEMDIPEDDPRNPAVIADNVGDNVGDVAGMGADLFESFVGSIIAAITLANGDVALVILPLWISGGGILASMMGFFLVGTKDKATQRELILALHKGTIVSSIFVSLFSAVFCWILFHSNPDLCWRVFGCIMVGLVAGMLIGQVSEYFTSYAYYPVKSIANAGYTGPATVLIQGLGSGMISTVFPVLILAATILACNALFNGYGIAISAVGMLSTLGITLATDAYGPIADNAGGIAEMADLDDHVRETTDALDALGNTTAATGKGFAIGSAVLTAISLLAAFKEKAQLDVVDVSDPIVLGGVLIGAMLPFLFAALTMLSVQKAAGSIILEVRRQFVETPGLREGEVEANSDQCVAIATQTSIEEMILPGLYAILSPVAIGFLIGPKCLTGLLVGSITSGMMLAIMMANAGGAWDNAKKFIEIEGAFGGKGSETHKACVVGDTVGDPFKDTSGPALNILIKLMSIVALTIAPFIKGKEVWETWYFGMIPLTLMAIGTYLVYHFFWRHGPANTVDTNAFRPDDSITKPEESESYIPPLL